MDLDTALKDVFGLDSFRPGQRVVVEAVLSGRHAVAVMPTGAGKSLCYQLPAVVAGGTALVVSPLIALMKDQVDALAARGVAACAFTSALAPGEMAARLADLEEGRVRIAYVAPERFKSPRFLEALERVPLSLLAVDEAHCISEWGHDFRPDYLRLGEFVQRWRPPRLLAVTATATPEVRADIVKRLGMTDPVVLVRGFDRPNLRFVVERMDGAKHKLARLRALVRGAGGPALVYSATRKKAEQYAAELEGAGARAAAYHAGLEDATRTRVQDAFMGGALDVVVATNAFGMGVDKADVRLVVHADLPKSCEAYYQEAGRAGRDGLPATCVLLFQPGDVRTQEWLIDQGAPSIDVLRGTWKALRDDPRLGSDERALKRALPAGTPDGQVAGAQRLLLRAGWIREREGVLEAVRPGDDTGLPPPAPLDTQALAARAQIDRDKLRAMAQYAYAGGCRRRYLLAYFGDEDAGEFVQCDACDACEGGGRRELGDEERGQVRAALRLVERLRGRFGRSKLAAILAATAEDDKWSECPEWGAVRAGGSKRALDVLRSLEGAALVAVSPGEYPTVSITPAGRRVADGVEEPSLALPAVAAGKVSQRRKALAGKVLPARETGSAAGAEPEPVDGELLARLTRYRIEQAQRAQLPAYCIFSNKTLEAIARARPADLTALAVLPGIGPARLEKYGREVLALVAPPPVASQLS